MLDSRPHAARLADRWGVGADDRSTQDSSSSLILRTPRLHVVATGAIMTTPPGATAEIKRHVCRAPRSPSRHRASAAPPSGNRGTS